MTFSLFCESGSAGQSAQSSKILKIFLKGIWKKSEIQDSSPIPVRDISQGGYPKSREKYIFGIFRTRTFLVWLQAVYAHLIQVDCRKSSKSTAKTQFCDIYTRTGPYPTSDMVAVSYKCPCTAPLPSRLFNPLSSATPQKTTYLAPPAQDLVVCLFN